MPATLRSLLSERTFRLRLVVGDEKHPVLDEPLLWAHSSDLLDPTPWLEPGQLLLTDGVQFAQDQSEARVDAYVERLRTRGIRVLGFATKVAHDDLPLALVQACRAADLPLVEVADGTPFMGIIRFVSDAVAYDERKRLEWSLQAQRAVARAALRPDALGAIVSELEKHLRCWVALYDSVGNRVRIPRSIDIPASLEASVVDAVRSTLDRGTRAGVRLSAADGGVTLQTLGQKDRLRGVLAVGTATPLDPAGNDLVASVIALASIALEQSREVETARRGLRSGLLELLLAGVIDVAGRTAKRLGGPLPSAPLRVTVLAEPLRGQSLLDELEMYADKQSGRLFFAERDDEVVAITRYDDTAGLEAILGRHNVKAGISATVDWGGLGAALDEGRRAAQRTSTEHPFVRFDLLAGEGMMGLLEASGGQAVARRMLQPLLTQDDADGRALLQTARIWLENNCAADPTAKALGIHRHTLRNRIRMLEELLGIDLSRFRDRSELWAALQFVPPAAEIL
ncbi:PucR family transcriptional regulator [Mycetocola sp.]|uniref:PucR family transcriptional regulator n=1 Tax=Mycetocola sp. TaxID=1871042 RepID=UPI0039898B48